MASSSSGGYVNVSRYDAFLSFRGGDTRNSFTDHLYEALRRAGVWTFRDNNDICRGEDLKPEIERGIRESRASIIVLSENYATSRWCLDELCLILQERKERNHFVLPIFYRVDTSDVKGLKGKFNIEVDAAKKRTKEKVERWNTALQKVDDINGRVASSGPETELLTEIVGIIKERLDLKQIYRKANLVGMESREAEINSWLEQSDCNMLAIWGMGGSGKTTLARHIAYTNWQKFDNISIIHDIGNKSSEKLRQQKEKLIREIIEGKEEMTPSVWQGNNTILNALKRKKVLIILDNVVNKKQLDDIIGGDIYNTESKIIITTRERNPSLRFSFCKECEMQLLNDGESSELLGLHAFKGIAQTEAYAEHTKKALAYCQGNPLALEVLGSSLNRNSTKQFWESILNSLEREIHRDIISVLKTGYDSLPQDSDKELFLHIACFFVGEDKDYVEKILERDLFAISGIVTLTSSCLLSISPNNKLMMHQLLQEMARTIVYKESPKRPGQRTRVWRHEESHEVLIKGKGSTNVEGLVLDMILLGKQRSAQGKSKLSDLVYTASFEKMDSLKLLQLNQLKVTGSFKNIFKQLRWLCWQKFCLEAIPPEMDMENMVALDMSCSKLEVFQPPDVLPLLKILNLADSHNLREIRNISWLLNLDTLILENCRNLVCDTLRGLTTLATVDITGCDRLCKREQPNLFERIKAYFGGKKTEQSSFLLPDSVQRLLLKDCNLESADIFLHFRDQSLLKYLNLANNPFEILPNYTHLEQLLILDLTGCGKLKTLLCLPKNLAELYISNCDSLERVTFELHKYTLQEFRYKGCVNLFEVEDFFKLVPVSKLEDTDLGNMKWLREYQDREVFLVGDGEVTKGRSLCLQMLYEFNIMSISLPDIEKPNMIPAYQYTSECTKLSFKVPESPKALKGLNLTFKYTMQGDDDWVWFAKIRTNNLKKVDLIYNAKVFGRPASDEVGIWLSYWPIGNSLHDGDEVNVDIVVMKGMEIKGCGASLVYTDEEDESDSFEDSNESFVDANDFFEDNNEFFEDSNESLEDDNESADILGGEGSDESFEDDNENADILGGEDSDESFEDDNANADILGSDISRFKLSTGTYYLCRRDYSQLMEVGRLSPSWFKNLVGDTDTIDYTEIGGWRKTGRPDQPYRSYTKLKTVGSIIYGPHLEELYKIEELPKSSLSDKTEEYTSESSKVATKNFPENLKIELEAIKSATNNFDDAQCIGKGRFGKVYKAELVHSKGRSVVALKRLDRTFGQGNFNFLKEVIMLSHYKHDNIVSLLGFCNDYDEMILVYEYASKGSLDLYLNDKDLTWVQRLKICIGVARGLAYLHNPGDTQQRVLHHNLKSSNILLDEHWNARITDFDLSKLGPANQESIPVGTFGYLDPSYMESYVLTKASDVYSFGVVLFELLCGRLCIDNNQDERHPLTILVRESYEQNTIDEIIYGNIKDEINPHSLKVFTTIAYQCLELVSVERPLMTEVVNVLERALQLQVSNVSLPPSFK